MAEITDQREDRFQRAQRIALDIIDECRVQLMLKFRFLDLALWKMESRVTTVQGRYALATDGTAVYLEPYTVFGRFDVGFDEVVRDYLHVVMHCIFRHPFDKNHERAEAWWLACDVIAESAAMELCGDRFPSALDIERRAALSDLRLMCGGHLTPGNLYGLFLKSLRAPEGSSMERVSGGRMNELRALFERDNHEAWPSYAKPEKEETPGDVEDIARPDDEAEEEAPHDGRDMVADGDSTSDDEDKQEIWDPTAARESQDSDNDGDSRDGDDDDAEGTSDDANDMSENGDKSGNPDDNVEGDWHGSSSEDEDTEEEVEDKRSEEEKDWEEIAKQIEMNLETFSKEWGEEAGSFMKSLAVANRKKYDYSDFLRRFAALSEEMKINDDEYDYVFYTYGLDLYGNMPLVEPLEYKETQRIRDFVICIDTSESCKGDLVRKFVEHTFSVIKKSEDYAHEVNIHVIQCDAKVQADTKITDLRDVDAFMDGFIIRGMGGTDFRPAFAYVNDLRDRGELPDMKGIIYFTDGLGQFPEKAPDYDTAFVFMDEGDNHIPSVPPWAMRVLIDEEGINRLKSEI